MKYAAAIIKEYMEMKSYDALHFSVIHKSLLEVYSALIQTYPESKTDFEQQLLESGYLDNTYQFFKYQHLLVTTQPGFSVTAINDMLKVLMECSFNVECAKRLSDLGFIDIYTNYILITKESETSRYYCITRKVIKTLCNVFRINVALPTFDKGIAQTIPLLEAFKRFIANISKEEEQCATENSTKLTSNDDTPKTNISKREFTDFLYILSSIENTDISDDVDSVLWKIVSARNSETNSQDMCDESRVNLIKEITHVADPTDDATSISFQRFLKILKQYWLKLITTTNQDLVIDYFHKDGYNFTEWFELIKNSPVTHYLQTIRPGGADFDIVLHKKSNHEEFKDALVFTSLVLSYSNNLLKLLKNNLPAEKISAKMKHFCEAVDTVSSFIAIFQALMPWSFTACLKELEIQMDSIQTDIDNVVFAFDDQQLVDLEFFKTLIVYDVDILCSVLGLQTQFSQFAKHVSVHMWLHDMQASNVVNWLKRNYESMSQAEANTETMSPSGILSQKLIFLGFTKRKAASIAENISEDWINHQTALELATTHILDMFQCHPVLTVASGFPYSSTVTDALFDQTVELNDGNTVSERSIKVINVSNMNNTDIQSDFQKHIKNSVPNGNIKLFHGTSHEDAKSILTKGIRLGRGRQFQDFSHGDGFYLSYVFNHAKERAIHKSKRPAIIVYRIAEVTLQEFDGLSLHEDIVCWRTTVKYCRKGYEGLMPKDFTDFHYIDGPMCRNPEGVYERNQEPATHVEEKKQLCVKKPDFAKVFNHPDNIVCVVFYREHIE